MNNQIVAATCPQTYAIALSEDGYVRMMLNTLLSIPLAHLVSGLDDDNPIFPKGGASLAHISGYTEWLSTTTPVITLGWDWRLDVSQGRPLYARVDTPRSNIMLVNDIQHDLGITRTSILLKTVVDRFDWREEVHKHIIARYV